MQTKLDCEIVRDLLPLYTDELTSEVTNQAVQAHLEGCADCTRLLQDMKAPEQPAAEAPQVEYLKKVHRRAGLRGLIIGVGLLVTALLLFGYMLFYVGSAASSRELMCTARVNDRTVTVSGEFISSGVGVARVTFTESAGMIRATVYTAPKAFFNSGKIEASYTANGEVDRVQVNELVLWEEGVDIEPLTAKLFAAVNPFVGDMPANSRIAELLGVNEKLGAFTNELQTVVEPYGWVIRLQRPLEADLLQTQIAYIRDTSMVMLASVKNLGIVTWEYTLNGVAKKFTMTAERATSLYGTNIKTCSATAGRLQDFLLWLGMQ